MIIVVASIVARHIGSEVVPVVIPCSYLVGVLIVALGNFIASIGPKIRVVAFIVVGLVLRRVVADEVRPIPGGRVLNVLALILGRQFSLVISPII